MQRSPARRPVNSPTNTRLNVGFGFGTPNSKEPGNYWILDYVPDYSWVIVSDPKGFSGYILTRDQTISADEYDALVAQARQLGVTGRITPTKQYPSGAGASVPGPRRCPLRPSSEGQIRYPSGFRRKYRDIP